MKKYKKNLLIKYYNKTILKYKAIIILRNYNCTTEDMFELKNSLKDEMVKIFTIKNSIMKISIINTIYKNIFQYIKGQNIIILSNSIINISNKILDFCNKNECIKFIICNTQNNILNKDILIKISKNRNIKSIRLEILNLIRNIIYKIVKTIKIYKKYE